MLVVAAVIERGGKILIGQRRSGDRHAHLWEFPGGKVEPGETPQAALARELREELDIEAKIGEEMARYHHQYPGRPLFELIFFRVTEFEGEPRNLAFERIQWVQMQALARYRFLEGAIAFVRSLSIEARRRARKRT